MGSWFHLRDGRKRSRDELFGRSLVGRRDGQSSGGSNDLGLGPLVVEVIQASPEGGQLALNLDTEVKTGL